MEIAKKTKEHIIYKKKSGRFAVQNATGDWLKAADKTKVLLDEKFIKLTPPKKKEEAPAAEAAPATDAAPASTDTQAS